MPKRQALLIAAILSCIVVAAGVAVVPRTQTPELHLSTVTVGDKRIAVEVADTDEERSLGLGKRDGLANGHGMLFSYDQPNELCFWMKDMRFNIDMVWIDQAKRVVKVASDVPAGSYPKTYCAPQAKPARYVLEVGAGQAAANGLREGVPVAF